MIEMLSKCQINLRHAYIDQFDGGIELRYGESGVAKPCDRLMDPQLMIGVISNGRINPKRFLIDGIDTQPIMICDTTNSSIVKMRYPGKSAFLYFHNEADRRVVGELVEITLAREPDRRDKLHVASVQNIEEAGWQAWWTPLPSRKNWLHVRLVPNCEIEEGRKPNLEEVQLLQQVFKKIA